MKFSKIIITILALLIAASSPLSAKTMRSTTGANLGKVETKGVGKENARLSIDSSNLQIEKVSYGTYGNQIYWENWQIVGGSIELQQSPNVFAHIEQSEVEKLFKNSFKNDFYLLNDIKINRIRKYLFQINYNYNNLKNCSYIFFTYGYQTNSNTSGDKNIRINLCDISPNLDKDVVSQEVLFLLGSIRHSGNKIRLGIKIPDRNSIENLGGIFSSVAPSNLDNKIDGMTHVPVALLVDGSGPFIGKLEYPSKNVEEGDLKFNGGKEIGSCSGKWQRKGNNFGVWYTSCDNGLSASGSYEMTGRAKGSGEGVDSKGRQIKITIGY